MSLGPARFLLLQLLKLLPKNLLSRLAGAIAAIPWPRPLQLLQIRSYSATWGVNLDEVRAPLASFRTMQDFFVRELKEGARPIDAAPDAFVSPCDGAWGEAGLVHEGRALQVKGRPYSVAQLVGDEEEARRYEGGAFATLYLSPKDYHRFHAPCDVRVTGLRYEPGALWPVNSVGVHGVDALFAKNERIVVTMECAANGKRFAYVAVGATVVGKVRLTFDDLTTNAGAGAPLVRALADRAVHLAKGGEVGRFLFGSTLVLVGEAGAFRLDPAPVGTLLRLGTRIGTVLG